MSQSTTPRSQNLNIRISPEDHILIKRVAGLEAQTVTEFVLDAVKAAAQDRLLDENEISLSKDQYKRFVEALDTPPPSNKALKKLLKRAPVWES